MMHNKCFVFGAAVIPAFAAWLLLLFLERMENDLYAEPGGLSLHIIEVFFLFLFLTLRASEEFSRCEDETTGWEPPSWERSISIALRAFFFCWCCCCFSSLRANGPCDCMWAQSHMCHWLCSSLQRTHTPAKNQPHCLSALMNWCRLHVRWHFGAPPVTFC